MSNSNIEKGKNKIKNFFIKQKSKFAAAGPGRKLNSEAPTPSSSRSKSSGSSSKDVYIPPKRKELSAEAKAAADAALSRVNKDKKEFNTSLAAIQAQVRRELEAERKAKELAEQGTSAGDTTAPSEDERKDLAVQGVYFRCPLISEEVLPRVEWKVKIKNFLYEQLEIEKGLSACLIIYNCNPKEKVETCVETLIKCLENIINHPNEEKYKKIRMTNRMFCDKIKVCEGALEFLYSAGFAEITIDDEPYLIWSEENVEQETTLEGLIEALKCSEPFHLELDRNIQVLLPSQVRKTNLPPDFFRISLEEIKREQQLRSEALEQAQILKTKAMREKEELRVINRYKFSLIRIRFPNGVYLQGTFNVYEKLSQVFEFVQSCLMHEASEFSLVLPTGQRFSESDMDKSLFDLRLVPNIVLNFSYENESRMLKDLLKEDLMLLIQSF
ncbi:UBX domain-containing protein 6 [Malaya genurostris]|uniref:UBX domain-containing protein 6 n=1 Tax=Malaya genurostris TaxID=325434 RepID=UPI0026F3AEDC|nr:UBX domain-containing protein 6 [Malaya genurostris]XP_058462700.1 UBX domain-containing protein 6 [Malaya genurostris]